MAKVLVVVPTDSAHIHVELVSRLIVWAKQGAVIASIAGVRPVDHARNEAVRLFLSDPRYAECTHLFFVDEDTVPPYSAITKLLALDSDIATGITKILRREENGEMVTVWNCFINNVENEQGSSMETVTEDTGVQKIIRAGTSCMLIKRGVFEKIQNPWFKTIWREDYTGYVSEDISFCDKVTALGMEILCDTTVKCAHYKLIGLE